MSPLRPVLVTRRDESAQDGLAVFTRLAAALGARGDRPTLLVVGPGRGMARCVPQHDITVVRLEQPSVFGGSLIGTLLCLRRWLCRHAAEIDLVYVSSMRYDAWAAISASGRGRRFPVVLRASCGGLLGDIHWQLDAACGYRLKQRCHSAAAFVAPCRSVAREVVAAGYARDRIQVIDDGVVLPRKTEPPCRRAARRALAARFPSLRLPAAAFLVVSATAPCEDPGIADLIGALSRLSARRSDLHAWIVCDDGRREPLSRQIEASRLAGCVVLAQPDVDLGDLLPAADVFVSPHHHEVAVSDTLSAMVVGLPTVVAATPRNREWIRPGVDGLVVEPGNPLRLAAAIESLCDSPAMALRLGTAARDRAATCFSAERMTREHAALFAQVAAGQRPHASGTSAEQKQHSWRPATSATQNVATVSASHEADH